MPKLIRQCCCGLKKGAYVNKLNLQYGEMVRLKGTNSELDGQVGFIIGVASRNILDTYIVDFQRVHSLDGELFSAVALWEACLERA